MFEKIKQDICKDYKISYPELLESQIVFNNRNENDNWNGIYTPFQYTRFKDNSIVVSSFSQLTTFANTYMELFKKDLFSIDAITYMKENLNDEITKIGLIPYGDSVYNNDSYFIVYGIEDEKHLPNQKVQESTIKFLYDTEYKTNSQLTQGRVYFGTLIDGEIVSIVSTSIATLECPEAEIVDIGVGTHENHRQKGYATSNIIAMSKYLLNNGHIVKYRCTDENTNSQKTAISSGFEELARQYNYRAKRNEFL